MDYPTVLLLFCDNNERRCGVDDRLSVDVANQSIDPLIDDQHSNESNLPFDEDGK
jgi:hypothetical protein